MSPLESKLRDVIHFWEECNALHVANHRDNRTTFTGAEVAAKQADAVRERARELEAKMEEWKREGLL